MIASTRKCLQTWPRSIERNRPRRWSLLGGGLPRASGLVAVVCYGVFFLLMLHPVANSALAVPLSAAVALASCKDAFTWLLFVSASQVVPDPPGLPLTLGQTGVAAWFLTLPLRRSIAGRHSLKPAHYYWRHIAFLVCWILLCDLIARGTVRPEFLVGPIVGYICYLYVIRDLSTIAPRAMLFGLLWGMSLPVIAYWGLATGVPVKVQQATARGVAGDRFVRVGGSRGDLNSAALNMAICSLGFLALARSGGARRRRPGASRKLWTIIVFVLLAASVPALMASVSRGALYTFVVGLGVLIGWECFRSEVTRARLVVAGVVALALFTVAGTDWVPQALSRGIEHVSERNLLASQRTDAPPIIAGRIPQWQPYLWALVRYPLTGVPKGRAWEFGVYGSIVVGRDKVPRVAHNTFLEFGAAGGLPAMALFALVMLSPAIKLRATFGKQASFPFVYVLACINVGFMALSVYTWKPLWALVGVMMGICYRELLRQKRGDILPVPNTSRLSLPLRRPLPVMHARRHRLWAGDGNEGTSLNKTNGRLSSRSRTGFLFAEL